MRKEERNEWIEIFIGGALGIVAVIAAIAEYVLGENGALAGCIKDIAGTLVVVVILFASIKIKPRNIDNYLNNELSAWIDQNSNMLLLAEDITHRDIYMRTDINNFFSTTDAYSTKGRFVKIEKNDKGCLKLIFSLNKGLFIGHDGEKANIATLLEPYGKKLSNHIQKFNDIASSHYDKSHYNLIVEMKSKTTSKDDVSDVMIIIDSVYNAFLVLASINA